MTPHSTPGEAPLIATTRLTLRRFRSADVPALQRYRSDPDVARYQSWTTPVTTEDAATLVRTFAVGDPARSGWFQYAVELDAVARLIGDIGVNLHDSGLEADVGFTLAPEHQRQGYAREAVTAVLHHLFDRGLLRVAAECDARNQRSRQLLQRVGFLLEERRPAHTWIKGQWTDDLLFGLPADRWRQLTRGDDG